MGIVLETTPASLPSPSGIPLVTVGEVMDVLESQPGGRARAAEIAAAVTSDFETLTGRLWAYRIGYAQDVVLESTEGQYVWLDLYPVQSLAVEYSPQLGTPAFVAMDPSGYVVDSRRGRVESVGSSARRFWDPFSLAGQAGAVRWPARRLRLTVTGGYVPATCPPDVKRACLLQAAFTAQRHQRANVAVAAVGLRDSSTSFLAPHYHPYFQSVAASHEKHT